LIHGICAPRSACAGCTHMVVAQNDPGQLRSILDTLLDDVAGLSSHNNPLPERSRPCSGAFCSGQPGTPEVPSGLFDWPGDSWAWCASHSGMPPKLHSFDSSGSAATYPVVRPNDIFHPPRLVGCFS
jgi:hypothetical protein